MGDKITIPISIKGKKLGKGYNIDLSKAYKQIRKTYNNDNDFSNLQAKIVVRDDTILPKEAVNLVYSEIENKKFKDPWHNVNKATGIGSLTGTLTGAGIVYKFTEWAIENGESTYGMPEVGTFCLVLPLTVVGGLFGGSLFKEDETIPPPRLVKEKLIETLDDAIVIQE